MCVEGDEHMFRIAICDDERQFRKRIHDILIEYMNEKQNYKLAKKVEPLEEIIDELNQERIL
mgnify:CR=1 FL=1